MSLILKHIRNQIHQKNRNFVGIVVGRVGTGKSYSAMRLAEELDNKFSVDKIFFNVEDLLRVIHEDTLYPGEVLILDEAGVAISNRQHYMNKFNKAMSFLLQTWRHRNLILFVTVPDIAFVDKGIRKMFDAILECRKVIKTQKSVRADWKFVQVNPQSGKAYFHNLKSGRGEFTVNIGKPSIHLIHQYEKKKKEFTDKLYRDLEEKIDNKITKDSTIEDIRRCPQCGNLGRYRKRIEKWKCYICNNEWENVSINVPKSLTLL